MCATLSRIGVLGWIPLVAGLKSKLGCSAYYSICYIYLECACINNIFLLVKHADSHNPERPARCMNIKLKAKHGTTLGYFIAAWLR